MAEIPEGILKKGGAFGKSYEAQSVEAYITELQLEIADAQDRAKRNLEKYNHTKKELDEANKKIAMLENLAGSTPHTESNPAENSGEQSDSQKIEDLEKTIVRKDLEIREKNLEVKELRKRVEKLEKPNNADIDILNNQIESLKQQLEESNEALSEANDILERKQQEISDLQSQNSAPLEDQDLQDKIAGLLQRNEMLEKQAAAFQTEATALRQALADASGIENTEFQELQNKFADICKERDALLAEQQSLSEEILSLKNQLDAASDTIGSLKSSMADYEQTQKRLEETETRLKNAQQQIDELKTGNVDSADIEVDMTEIYAEAQRSASQIVNAAKKTAEKLKKETDTRSALKIQEAEAQAAEILNQAKQSSEQLLADANSESERIIHEATDSVSVLQGKIQKEQDTLDAMISTVRAAVAQKLHEVSEIARLSSDQLIATVKDTSSTTAPVPAPHGEENPDDFVYESDDIPSTTEDAPSAESNSEEE